MNDNAIIVEAWNTVLFDKFVRFKHLLIAGLAGHSDEVFSRRLYSQGARVLDVGCGFGDSTLRIAQAVGPAGYRAESGEQMRSEPSGACESSRIFQ